ncbi:Pycsar system effector family protein [Aestuariivirga litoralis]|uniref:Pycsar system effector family protein n=1 Tax=Aestuariivirga litoralis TaxID=2650924 RepID=UPI0018C5C73B|nr:Pycsar system effector family protein [Aestuariivirga litoralis]MBG1231039.1 hypothetical protein [Aestuariivirga litoralis]
MPNDEIQRRAELVFSNVVEWVKFAELKNGALVTLNAAFIIGTHQIADWQKPSSNLLIIWLWFSTACFLLSIIVGLGSFASKTKIDQFDFMNGPSSASVNPLFFGHIRNLSVDDYLAKLAPNKNFNKRDEWVKNIASQTIINSKIAQRKFSLFNLALAFFVLGVSSPVGAVLFYWKYFDEKF